MSALAHRLGEPLLTNALVDTGTDSLPTPSDDDVHTAYAFNVRPQPADPKVIRDHLRHTAICDDPAVVSAVGAWIADGVRPQSAGGR